MAVLILTSTACGSPPPSRPAAVEQPVPPTSAPAPAAGFRGIVALTCVRNDTSV